jgi:competence protein ComEA
MSSIIKGMSLLMALLLAPQALLAGPVNINTANAEMLAAELVGIGPALAAAIVRDREENGPYKSADELKRVRGVGDSVIANNRENIRVEEAAAAAPAPAPAAAATPAR